MRNVFSAAASLDAVWAVRASVARYMKYVAQRTALASVAVAVAAANPLWMMLGALLWALATLYCRRTERQAALIGKAVSEAMTRQFVTLTTTVTLGEANALAVRSAQRFYPVMDGERGEAVVGVASDEELYRGMLKNGATASVAGVMECEFPTVAASAPLSRVAPRLHVWSAPLLAFSGGRLVGILTCDSLNQYLRRAR